MSNIAPIAESGKYETPEALSQLYAALPWRIARNGVVEVLLVTGKTNRQWTLPKISLGDGQTPERAAARAAFEQAGVTGQVLNRPIGGYSDVALREDRAPEPCHVTLFGLHVKGTLLNWLDRNQRRRSWQSIEGAADLIGETELARLLRSLQYNPGAFR